jgi:hypothetical protein
MRLNTVERMIVATALLLFSIYLGRVAALVVSLWRPR